MHEKLKAAIEVMAKLDSPLAPDYVRQHMGIVLAAARAYACERCGGTGEIGNTEYLGDDCPECKKDREVADA